MSSQLNESQCFVRAIVSSSRHGGQRQCTTDHAPLEAESDSDASVIKLIDALCRSTDVLAAEREQGNKPC
jgi:hypothetical protein